MGTDSRGQTQNIRKVGVHQHFGEHGNARWPGAGPLSQQERWENEGGNTGKMFNLGSDTQ